MIRMLDAREARDRVDELCEILIDCVEGGASVSFILPMTRDKAVRFWSGVADGVAAGTRTLLVAQDDAGKAVGTVQVVHDLPENQPHRADVAKMLVMRAARKQGLGAKLMQSAEDAARAIGKRVLVLDTASADAERLYERMGWQRVGTIPQYALLPEGGYCDTVYFFKLLS